MFKADLFWDSNLEIISIFNHWRAVQKVLLCWFNSLYICFWPANSNFTSFIPVKFNLMKVIPMKMGEKSVKMVEIENRIHEIMANEI